MLDSLYELLTTSDYLPDKTEREAFPSHEATRRSHTSHLRDSYSHAQQILGAADLRVSSAWGSPPRGQTLPLSPQTVRHQPPLPPPDPTCVVRGDRQTLTDGNRSLNPSTRTAHLMCCLHLSLDRGFYP